MLDGYTTTDRYPYSQSINPGRPERQRSHRQNLNYVRNSVKATVDAYDGTIHFYVVDPKDPIIRTYRKAFPDLFEDVSAMPAGLQDHWRYPVDLFDTQTEQYTQYHMTDPQQFFQKAALWDVARARASPTPPRPRRSRGRRQQRRAQLDARVVGQPDRSAVSDDADPGRDRPGVRARTTIRAAQQIESALVVPRRAQRRRELRQARALPSSRPVERAVAGARRVADRSRSEDQQDLLAPRPAGFEGGARRDAARTDEGIRSSTCGRSTSRAPVLHRCLAGTTSR